MCLKIVGYRIGQNDLNRRHYHNQEHAWKVVAIKPNGRIVSAIREVAIRWNRWFLSSRKVLVNPMKITRSELRKGYINHGFHVFLKREDAREYRRYLTSFDPFKYKVVKVEVDPKTFVTVGGCWDLEKAVFHRIKYTKG